MTQQQIEGLIDELKSKNGWLWGEPPKWTAKRDEFSGVTLTKTCFSVEKSDVTPSEVIVSQWWVNAKLGESERGDAVSLNREFCIDFDNLPDVLKIDGVTWEWRAAFPYRMARD